MAKSRAPALAEREPEPEKVAANANPQVAYDGASAIYKDKSGKPHALIGSEGHANFSQITAEAHATVAAARHAESTGGDASHGPKEGE